MSAPRATTDGSLLRTWVHVFEDDTGDHAVYRPESDALPRSRRPRERLKLEPDGVARLWVPSPDDRLVEQRATWREEGDVVVLCPETGHGEWRIVERSPQRLVVQIGAAADPKTRA
jgi:hypothetical protein